MAQHLRDLAQRRALPEHRGRGGVPKLVRPDRRYPSANARVVNHAAHPNTGEHARRAVRRARTPPGTHAGPTLQIRHQRLADTPATAACPVGRATRVTRMSPAPPAVILESDRGDLAGAQPEPDQHQQDRYIPPSDRPPPIAIWPAGGPRPAARPRAAAAGPADLRRRAPPTRAAYLINPYMQIPQQRPQPGHQLPGARLLRRGQPSPRTRSRPQPSTIQADPAAAAPRTARDPLVASDRRRRQPALLHQVVAIAREQPRPRSLARDDRRWRTAPTSRRYANGSSMHRDVTHVTYPASPPRRPNNSALCSLNSQTAAPRARASCSAAPADTPACAPTSSRTRAPPTPLKPSRAQRQRSPRPHHETYPRPSQRPDRIGEIEIGKLEDTEAMMFGRASSNQLKASNDRTSRPRPRTASRKAAAAHDANIRRSASTALHRRPSGR